MERHTITEALAEIKLIEKKIEKKSQFIRENIVRFEHLPDAFAKEGGSSEYLKRESQAMVDLWQRLVKLRAGIAKANIEHQITVEGVTRTISEWLAWKRDVQEDHLQHLKNLAHALETQKRANEQAPKFSKDDSGTAFIVKPVYNIDSSEVQKQLEQVMTIKERLDGQLSLKNATIVLTIE